ncbi:SCO family protein [Lutimonas zeaxanthinifaciens]|uniref:SCO family protein n=1 Tax=Lutimonas zeaxanthinifaciens TaxID=3060215 RepID=UPI00265D02E3|nr:SCO family protein [Lutimonas sp. YSD2104]WKK66362.1 SCO family protein [Lutimonas sp. YSD2104]
MKKNSYIAIAFVILIFGIWAIPKILNKLGGNELLKFEQVPSFEFTNQDKKKITNADFEGKVYVVEFFFTSCPTICPQMNENMVKIQNEFYGNPDFGIASVSIDPERDTPEVLKIYAKEKGATLKNWHFLTGEKSKVYSFSNDGFKLYAGENKDVEGGFEHSGLFALIDKNGFIRSRTVINGEMENPIKFYNGLDEKEVQWIKEDIKLLLKE